MVLLVANCKSKLCNKNKICWNHVLFRSIYVVKFLLFNWLVYALNEKTDAVMLLWLLHLRPTKLKLPFFRVVQMREQFLR